MKLFGHPESGHAFKVKFFMAVADIAHEYIEVDIFAPRETRLPEFRDQSRFHEVPLLIDQGKALVQSNVILMHLAGITGGWGAEDPDRYRRCQEWLLWEANKIGMCLPQLRAANRFPDDAPNPGAIQWLSARYAHDIAIINQELQGGQGFIVGDSATIADFSLCGYLFFADEAGVSVPANVQDWLDRLAALPGWRHPYVLMKG